MVEVRKERHISQEEALAKSLLKISEVDPKDIPKFIGLILTGNADFLIGNRFKGLEKGAMSFKNKIGNLTSVNIG